MAAEYPSAVERITDELEGLTDNERAILARRLFETADRATRLDLVAQGMEDLEEGRQPFPIFIQMARVVPLATYEAAMIRPSETDEGIEVVLKQRKSEGENRDVWDGQWHIPGTALSSDDEHLPDFSDFSVVRNRLFKAEAGDALRLTDDPFFLPPVRRPSARGKEITIRELVPVELKGGMGLPSNTEFVNVRNVLANPPEGGFVETHELFLTQLLEKYNNFYETAK
jgi:hypothetical protein